jgi:gas vesicle protein
MEQRGPRGEVKRGCPIVGTATRRIILVGSVALFSILLVPPATAQIPNLKDVQDTADDATQGAQDAVDDVQDTADDATQGAQDAVDDVQDTADDATQGAQSSVDDVEDTVDSAGNTATGAQQDVEDAVGDTADSAADKASGAVPGSSTENARSAAEQLSGGKRPSTTESDEDDSPADLAELVAAGNSIEGTIDASVDTGSRESGPLERAWDFLGLPLTGAELLAIVAVGLTFISAGAVLWRRARSRTVGGPGDSPVRQT